MSGPSPDGRVGSRLARLGTSVLAMGVSAMVVAAVATAAGIGRLESAAAHVALAAVAVGGVLVLVAERRSDTADLPPPAPRRARSASQ